MLGDGTDHNKIIRPTLSINPRKSVYIPQVPKGLIIVRDTREGLPYSFNNRIPYVDKALRFGDYSIKGMENLISIERKTLSDFYGSIGGKKKEGVLNTRRERLHNEFGRMKDAGVEFKALVIEAEEEMVLTPELSYSRLNSNSIYGTIVSFELRYNIHIYYGDRKACQVKMINWFVKFWRLKIEEDKIKKKG